MSEPAQHRLDLGRLARCRRGLISTVRIYQVPLGLGHWRCRSIDHLASDQRRDAGLVLVLPGIEGRSTLNVDIAQGLVDGGVTQAVEVHDWATGRLFSSLYHLRSTSWHARQAARLAEKIADYQDAFPNRPVVLVGHSGGAALSLEALPLLGDRQVSGAIFLAAAVSPGYDTTAARRRIQHAIWSFHSPFDWLQCGLGTLLVGTYDGRHTFSSGMIGFCEPRQQIAPPPRGDTSLPDRATGDRAIGDGAIGDGAIGGWAPLHQIRYRFAMLRSWNFGGHHGWTNRVFAAEWLARLVQQACAPVPLGERDLP